MDEDDFKESSSETPFEHLVPKSFLSLERKQKNRLAKALGQIKRISEAASHLHTTFQTPEQLLNGYALAINQILNTIKDVDNHNKQCED